MEIVLYGAGKMGRKFYKFLKTSGYANDILGFCDENARKIVTVEGKKVWLPEELEERDVIFVIAVSDAQIQEEIRQKLGKENCIEFSELADYLHVNRVEFNREFCAFSHIDDMDTYFQEAEKTQHLNLFWSSESIFHRMFQKLDVSNIIELACGRGRHVGNYLDKAEKITLVDILQKNIDFCKKRFGENRKINFYRNNGYDLKELESNSYSALFSYDAMVHFELIDIYTYLNDIYRVLWGVAKH